MASPNPVYVPPPPRGRSIVGPLILIVVGVLFLLRNMGYALPLFQNFVKYWPLLLVLIGLIRLGEFFVARRAQRPVPVMGGGTVFLLVIVITIGAAATAAFHGRHDINWGQVRDNVEVDDDLMHLFGNEYSYDGELAEQMPADGMVSINCDRGTITVNNWDQPQVKVVFHKRVFASSQGDADKTNGATAPKIQVQGRTVQVMANTEAAGSKGVAANLEVFVPNKADLELNGHRGDVSVTERTGNVKVNLDRGNVTVDKITGNVNVSSHHGSLSASNINGNLTMDGRLDDLSLDNISGKVFITADIFGDTRLSNLQKGVTIHTSRTDLQFAKLDGDLTMSSGDLQGNGLLGPVSLTTKAKDIDFRDLKGDIRINNDRGDITLSPSALGNVDLTTHHGDVHLRLPSKSTFQYSMTTRHGDISSEFENVNSQGHGGGSTASGNVGKGGVRINVTTDTGDINISKAGNGPEPPLPPPPAPKAPAPKTGKKVGDVDVM